MHKEGERPIKNQVRLILYKTGSAIINVKKMYVAQVRNAARKSQIGRLERLLQREEGRAVVNMQDRFYKTPLDYAAKNGCMETIALLIAAGANTSRSLQAAVEGQKINIVEYLLFTGADPNSRYNRLNDLTPVHYALFSNQYEVFHLLVKYGANLNQYTVMVRNNRFKRFIRNIVKDDTKLKLMFDNGFKLSAMNFDAVRIIISMDQQDIIAAIIKEDPSILQSYYVLRHALRYENYIIAKMIDAIMPSNERDRYSILSLDDNPTKITFTCKELGFPIHCPFCDQIYYRGDKRYIVNAFVNSWLKELTLQQRCMLACLKNAMLVQFKRQLPRYIAIPLFTWYNSELPQNPHVKCILGEFARRKIDMNVFGKMTFFDYMASLVQ